MSGIETATCRHCGTTGAIRVETRTETTTKPIGSFSLAGVQVKTTAVVREWPWAVCTTSRGGCGHESRGEPVSAADRFGTDTVTEVTGP